MQNLVILLALSVAALVLSISAQSATWMQSHGGMGEYKTKPLPSPTL